MIADGKNERVFNCAIIVLAAAASNRLGMPKQLLPYRVKKPIAKLDLKKCGL